MTVTRVVANVRLQFTLLFAISALSYADDPLNRPDVIGQASTGATPERLMLAGEFMIGRV
jgi:hypothetical protein